MSYSNSSSFRSRLPVFPSDQTARYDTHNNNYLQSINNNISPSLSRPLGYFSRKAYYYNSPLKQKLHISQQPYVKTDFSPSIYFPNWWNSYTWSQASFRPDVSTWKWQAQWQPYPIYFPWNVLLSFSEPRPIYAVIFTVVVDSNITVSLNARDKSFEFIPIWNYTSSNFTLVPGVNTVVLINPGWSPMGIAKDKIWFTLNQYTSGMFNYEIAGIDVIDDTAWDGLTGTEKNFISSYWNQPALHLMDNFRIPMPYLPSPLYAFNSALVPANLPSLKTNDYYAGINTNQPPCTFEAIMNAPVASIVDIGFFLTLIIKLKPHRTEPMNTVNYRINGGTPMTAAAFFKSIVVENLPYIYIFSTRASNYHQINNMINLEIADTQNVYGEKRTTGDLLTQTSMLYDLTNSIQLLGQNSFIVFISAPRVVPPYARADLVEWQAGTMPFVPVDFAPVICEVRGNFTFSSNAQVSTPGVALLSTFIDSMSAFSMTELPISIDAESSYRDWLEGNWGLL